MDKKLTKTIVGAILGFIAVILLISEFGLIFNAIGIRDLIMFEGERSTADLLGNLCIALACILAPALISYVLAYIYGNKILNIFAAVCGLFIAVTATAFTFKLRGVAISNKSLSDYATVAASYAEFMQIAVCSLIACAYFTFKSVTAFKAKPAITNGETNEEFSLKPENKEANGNEEV